MHARRAQGRGKNVWDAVKLRLLDAFRILDKDGDGYITARHPQPTRHSTAREHTRKPLAPVHIHAHVTPTHHKHTAHLRHGATLSPPPLRVFASPNSCSPWQWLLVDAPPQSYGHFSTDKGHALTVSGTSNRFLRLGAVHTAGPRDPLRAGLAVRSRALARGERTWPIQRPPAGSITEFSGEHLGACCKWLYR